MPQYKHQCILYESCGESELKKLINFLPKKNRDFYATKEAIEFALAEQYAQQNSFILLYAYSRNYRHLLKYREVYTTIVSMLYEVWVI